MSTDKPEDLSNDTDKTAELENRIDDITKRISSLEPDIVAQEHRIGSIARNLYRYFVQETGDEENLRRKRLSSAYAAINWIWKLSVARIVLLGGGGAIAVLTLIIGFNTLQEFKEQNQTLRDQNNLVAQQQNELVKQNQYLQDQNIQTLRSVNAEAASSLIKDIQTEYYQRKVGNEGQSWELPLNLIYRITAVSRALVPYDTIVTHFLDGRRKIYPDSIRWPGSHDLQQLVYHIYMPYDDMGAYDTVFVSPERGFLLGTLINLDVKFPLSPSPNFEYAILRDAQLDGANLEKINLYKADLRNSTLNNSNLSLAQLIDANLTDVNLSNSLLFNTDLTSAHLRRVEFDSSQFSNGIFINADLIGASFANCLLYGSIFTNADLRRVNFSGATLTNVNIGSANVFEASFGGTKIDTTYQLVFVNKDADSLANFVSYALSRGAIAWEGQQPLPDSLQNPNYYRYSSKYNRNAR
ncbi:pentapeptide repeat-containing protein [Tunicatimonas pelagia]|uniref:pentapeptide repeat-containing protein n=1 Tax=Tunicatimonas pelagia TaxID=931531 RepID=UPI002665D78E|nr:pentapeptide repeat-containing protein [Tunicatimonas pelagia]WKN45542.1 pentapeptide repeat-containing protein [Tunicatimonas pelagia]